MDYKLKPCPWCGGGAEVIVLRALEVAVGCGNAICPAFPQIISSTKASAVRVWNTRAEAPAHAD